MSRTSNSYPVSGSISKAKLRRFTPQTSLESSFRTVRFSDQLFTATTATYPSHELFFCFSGRDLL